MKKKIYAFYQSIPAWPQSEEFARANLWKQSWQKAGWECVMLNSSHAKGTNQQIKLGRKMAEDPTFRLTNQKLVARFMRWCALMSAGGGWMSDYDVLNIGFTPKDAEALEKENQLHLLLDRPSCVFYATKNMCANVIQMFLSSVLSDNNVSRNECLILNYSDPGLTNLADKIFHPSAKKKSEEMAKKLAEILK